MSNKQFTAKIAEAVQKARAYLLSKYQISGPDLDDVLQEASLKAMKNLKSFRGKCSFYTWFISICKNEIRYFFRNASKQERRFLSDSVQKVEGGWHEAEILR